MYDSAMGALPRQTKLKSTSRSTAAGINWSYDENGTLLIAANDVADSGHALERGTFEVFRKQVRRIEISGYPSVANDVFSYYPALEEIVIQGDDLCSLGNRAFAHCHKLSRVIVSGHWKKHPRAFEDTPYQAQSEGVPFQPQFSPIIALDAHGKDFLTSLRHEIDAMHEQPDGDRVPGDPWPFDRNTWFDSSLKALVTGWANNEPTLSYLMAEYLGNSSEGNRTYYQAELAKANGSAIDSRDSELEPPTIYLSAARNGSPHAQLWLAFCLEKGICGWESDPGKSKEMLNCYMQQSKPLETLELPELGFMADEIDRLVEAAYDADLCEDLAADGVGYSKPNPSWRTLHLRALEIADFQLSLGRSDESERVGYPYKWDCIDDFDERAEALKKRKEAWEAWCSERDLL